MEKSIQLANVKVTSFLQGSSGSWTGSSTGAESLAIDFGLPNATFSNVMLALTVGNCFGGSITVGGTSVAKNQTVIVYLPAVNSQNVIFTFKTSVSNSLTNSSQQIEFTNIVATAIYENAGSGNDDDTPTDDITVGNWAIPPNYLPRIVSVVKTSPAGVFPESYTCVPGHTLHPTKMRVELKADPPSTASMTINEPDVEINVGTLVRVLTPHGDAGLFYAKRIKTDCLNAQERTVELVHTFDAMRYAFLPGKHKPATINTDSGSGDKSTTDSSALAALRYVFSKQSAGVTNGAKPIFRWYLYENDFPFSSTRNQWEFENCSARDAVDDVTDCIENCEWRFSFDYSNAIGYAHLVRQETKTTAEIRQSRNALSVVADVDLSQMYNMVYPIGKRNKTIDSITSSQQWTDEKDPNHIVWHHGGEFGIIDEESAKRWGLITAVKTESSKETLSALMDWAAVELMKNSSPIISVRVDAVDLSTMTGVQIDRLRVGKRCRIPLPQYGFLFEERITAAEWADMISDPYSIRLTIANDKQTIESVTRHNNKIIRKKIDANMTT